MKIKKAPRQRRSAFLVPRRGFAFLRKGKFPSLHGESSRGEGMPLSYEIKPRAKNKKPPIG